MTDVIADPLTPGQLEAIVRALDCAKEKLPVDAIQEARRHREQVIPELIKLMQRATQTLRQDEIVEGNGAFMALFLLAEFRAAEGLPAILDAVSLPDDGPFELFGDAIHDVLHRVLISLGKDGCLDICCTLFRNAAVNIYVRWSAATAIVCTAIKGMRPRAEIVDLCRRLLAEQIEKGDVDAVTGMLATMIDLNPREATQEIHDAYERDLVDEGMIDRESAYEHLQDKPMEDTHAYRQSVFVEDTMKELEHWASFQPKKADLPRTAKPALAVSTPRHSGLPAVGARLTLRPDVHVGRNDPCPCGSGKKFKRCCLGRR